MGTIGPVEILTEPLAGALQRKDILYRGILHVAQPRQRINLAEINHPVNQHSVINMYSDHTANDHAVDTVSLIAG